MLYLVTRIVGFIQVVIAIRRATKPTESGDEWVDPWIRQQKRVQEALANAKRHSGSASITGR
jgi:hypothetical protein